jgi:hypothetical protein
MSSVNVTKPLCFLRSHNLNPHRAEMIVTHPMIQGSIYVCPTHYALLVGVGPADPMFNVRAELCVQMQEMTEELLAAGWKKKAKRLLRIYETLSVSDPNVWREAGERITRLAKDMAKEASK